MDHPITKPEEFSRSFLLKRVTLLGAALGMFVGLISLCFAGVKPASEIASIIFWRNCILIGAAAGLCVGVAASWWFRTADNKSSHSHNHAEHAANSPNRTP